jgi:hypothetical protein
MLRILYRWRYRRAQKAESFRVPSDQGGCNNARVSLGSYMSQSSVHGRTFDRFDLPRKRRRGVAILLAVLAAILIG